MNKYILRYIVLFMVMVQSCSDGVRLEPLTSSEALQITSTIYAPTHNRMTGSAFEEGDQVGLFLVPYLEGSSSPGDITQSGYASNVNYQYTDGLWQPLDSRPISWPGERYADVYGYYPYDPLLTDAHAHRFSVEEDQRPSANYTASDFLWARAEGLAPTKQVELSYSHRLAKVNVNITSSVEDFGNGGESLLVHLSNIYTEATIDLAEGRSVIPSGALPRDVFLNKCTSSSDDPSVLRYTAIVIPQSVPQGERVLVIQNQGVIYTYKLAKDIVFESGATFTFNVLITDGRLIVTVASIDDWIDADQYEGVLTRYPRVLDINGLDWDASNVYYIYNKETLVGMVAKEYLFSRSISKLDFPAIVVYTADEEGNADLSRGLVAQVLQRTMNSSSEDFDANTGSVHGGTVVFSSTVNEIAQYITGSLPLISKVEFASSGELKAADDHSLPTLTTRPYRLEDVDGNSYPIVKIAKQYWTRENLKTEHYRDGSAIPVYYFDNDRATYRDLYGGLYTWTDLTDARGMVPNGWHVPDEAQWWELRDYLYPSPAYKLKKRQMWNSMGSTDNVAFFSALPGGRRLPAGTFNELLSYGQWWSSTERNSTIAWRVYFGTGAAIGNSDLTKTYAESVRLLKDY